MSLRVIVGCDAVHPDNRGGQHVAKKCTGVMMVDDDLGIGVMVNSERSMHGNQVRAERLFEQITGEPVRKQAVRHVVCVQLDTKSHARGGTTRMAVCTCGWVGPERATLVMAADDGNEHEARGGS